MNAATSDAATGLSFEVDRDHVGWVTFDRPGSSVNVLAPDLLRELDQLLSQLESRIANGQILALVLHSGKEGSFFAGADVGAIAALSSAAEARAASAEGQRIFRRIERLRVPTVAAVDGACMGGGTEMILHCDFRIASDRESTAIGLPEVRLGILPGFGGTVKLPPLVGLQNALQLILSGKAARPSKALRIGLVDRVAPADGFQDAVREFVARIVERRVERSETSPGLAQRFLEGTSLGRRILFRGARQRARAEAGPFYPAPLRAIDVLAGSVGLKPDEAYAREAEALGELAVTPVSRNLVRVFQLSQAARKALPADAAGRGKPVRRMGVIGAGVMGAAIAEIAAARDIPVTLKDIDRTALDSGLRHANDLLRKAADAGVFSREDASLKFALIDGTLDYSDLEEASLIVEAVVERMAVKQQVFREATKVAPDAVLATNTSSLSVNEMANGLEKPGSVVGLHFFNPVHRMPLVEVVAGPRTRPDALATAFDLALRLGKTPVLVADRPGFLVNRLLAPYLNEAGYLVEEGQAIEAIDGALEGFGMPMGPLRLLDQIGFDVARHASREMASAFGQRLAASGVLDAMIEDARLGKKNGFTGKTQEGRAAGGSLGGEEIIHRCLYPMVNEATFLLEEHVVEGPGVVDLAMVMGTGFPPFRGGLLAWADTEGITGIHAALVEYAAALGSRFAPSPLLARMAEQNRTFTDSH